MVNFIYKRAIFRVREMAFISIGSVLKEKCDVIYLHSEDKEIPVDYKPEYAQYQYTYVNDLSESEDFLFSNVKKNCKYEIRRAEKEGAIFVIYHSRDKEIDRDILNKFEMTYNNMFRAKGIPLSFNRSLINKAMENGQLVVSVCYSNDDLDNKVYHAYLVDETNAILIYSTSSIWELNNKEDINRIGRFNKFLHWQDMKWFMKRNYLRYEWGGIANPQEPNGIDKFKGEFGGEICAFYNYLVSASVLGKLYIYLVKRRAK